MRKQDIEAADVVELGISYLRVSTKRQMDTDADVDPDGNSVNTQREHCGSKAKSMRVVLQKEFIEPGNSAQSIDKRPVFKEVLKYLREHPEIKYVFIYMRSRAFRNFTDAAITKRALLKIGVKLISAKEDFGEGIMADAMEAVTDIMNEVQVRLSGQDISVKMANKARNGGTIGQAKLGYLNEKVLVEGRKVNSVVIDQERAPLVRHAFELFATGQHTLDTLWEILADAGLRAPGRDNPVGRETLRDMLRSRYYIGKVIYKGIEYQGRHEPLISEELFDRVQRVLDAHSGSGTRQRQHHHYLKDDVWCGRCGDRFIIMPGRGNGGTYFYFMCRGRQKKTCDHPYVPVDVMEQGIEQHYSVVAESIILPPELRTKIRAGVTAAVAEQYELSDDLRDRFNRQLDKLDRKESYFLDLAAEEDWPKDKLRAKLNAIRLERKQITRQLDTAANQLDTGRQVFTTALDLLDDPAELYRQGNERVRATLNKAFFTRLYFDGRKVTSQDLAEPFDLLHEAYIIYRQPKAEQRPHAADSQGRTYHRAGVATRPTAALTATSDPTLASLGHGWPQTASSADLPQEASAADRSTLIQSLAVTLAGHGSSNRVMVELRGLEPLTPT